MSDEQAYACIDAPFKNKNFLASASMFSVPNVPPNVKHPYPITAPAVKNCQAEKLYPYP
jgi:hypothetical protein